MHIVCLVPVIMEAQIQIKNAKLWDAVRQLHEKQLDPNADELINGRTCMH